MRLESSEDLVELFPSFDALRPDEKFRVARRIRIVSLQAGEKCSLDRPMLIVIGGGELLLTRREGERTSLYPGDSVGSVEVLAGRQVPGTLSAVKPSVIGVVDEAAAAAILGEFPIVAVAWVNELARELRWRNDLLREILLARSAKLPPLEMQLILRRRLARLKRRRQYPLHRIAVLIVRSLITEPARRRAFWVFAGASLALVSARTMVGLILRRGLQEHLFALIETTAGNPIHVHHFNYGLLLVAFAGVLAMIPRARRALRALSFIYGFGLGLVIDEFALLWNLNPDYYQPLSRLAAALLLFALFQVVYFRSLYLALGRRLVGRITT